MKINIVGCGVAGSASARILSDKGHDVQIFESRNHIGGNCFDSYLNNVMVHNYGPHVFHTESEEIWSFFNRFTKFNNFILKVMAQTQRGLIPIPYSNRARDLIGDLTPEQIKKLIFIDYSEKRWGVPWEKIPEKVTKRLSLRRDSDDDRYLCDKYQGIPEFGYTRMFENMLEGIPVHLGCDKNDWRKENCDLIIYTGKLDEYFNYCFGKLPYRSLSFDHIASKAREHCVINNCTKNVRYTRTFDNRHWLFQDIKQTIITHEYPCEHTGDNEPFYPMLFDENILLKDRYMTLAEKEKNVIFLGRLATYRYLDITDVMEDVLIRVTRI